MIFSSISSHLISYRDPNFDREAKSETAKLVVDKQVIDRNLRCVLAYLYNSPNLMYRNARADRLHRLAWEGGKAMPEHIKDNLSVAEINYYQKYLMAVDNYNKHLSEVNNIDLTVDLSPPKDLFIEVRVNIDYGTVTLPESG